MLEARARQEAFAAPTRSLHDERRAKEERERLKKRAVAKRYMAVLGITVVAALLHVGLYANILQCNNHIRELQANLAEGQKENEQLEVQVARLSSFERVDREARERLHMAPGGAGVLVAALPSDDGPSAGASSPAVVARRGENETALARLGRWISSIGYAEASTGDH